MLHLKVRIPSAERRGQFLVDHFDPRSQKQMCSLAYPLHLLFLDKAFANQRVDWKLSHKIGIINLIGCVLIASSCFRGNGYIDEYFLTRAYLCETVGA